MKANQEYLFDYHFRGAKWGTSVFADSEQEAMEKIKAQSAAIFKGKLGSRIDVPTKADLFGMALKASAVFLVGVLAAKIFLI